MKTNPITDQLKRLKDAGIDCSCRCPKPCMRHSDYYRAEELRRLPKARKPKKDQRPFTVAEAREVLLWLCDIEEGTFDTPADRRIKSVIRKLEQLYPEVDYCNEVARGSAKVFGEE